MDGLKYSAKARNILAGLLARADIQIDGTRPWDMRVYQPSTFGRILAQGSMGLGESYMQGWWDCERVDMFIDRVLRAQLHEKVSNPARAYIVLKSRFMNVQSVARAWHVAREHYDLGNELFEAMLDPSMAYSCGYWAHSESLAAAQQAKLELVCQKLQLQPGMRLLDIGCGWGSLMRYAAKNHGVECVGLTVSREQAAWGEDHARGLPVRFVLADYREFNQDGHAQFDRVASIGMFEHVGHKNYGNYFGLVRRCLDARGLFLLHTIGKNRPGLDTDPWAEKYIFPNGVTPSLGELVSACERDFVVEDVHNFGADYDRTLMAWLERFDAAWEQLQAKYSGQFRRMWRYYLMACAGTFRARDNQLWQLVLSPRGVLGGYRSPSR